MPRSPSVRRLRSDGVETVTGGPVRCMNRITRLVGLTGCPSDRSPVMTVARSVDDVLADHVRFQVECIDRMFLNKPMLRRLIVTHGLPNRPYGIFRGNVEHQRFAARRWRSMLAPTRWRFRRPVAAVVAVVALVLAVTAVMADRWNKEKSTPIQG